MKASPWSIRRGKKSIIINHKLRQAPLTGWQLYIPPNPDDEGQLGFCRDVVVSNLTSHSGQADLPPVHLLVFLMVAFSPLVDQLSSGFAGLETRDVLPSQMYGMWRRAATDSAHTDWVSITMESGLRTAFSASIFLMRRAFCAA